MTKAKHLRLHSSKPHAHAKKGPGPIANDNRSVRKNSGAKEQDRSGYDSNVNQSAGSGTGGVNLRDEERTTGSDINLAANNLPERSTGNPEDR